MKYFNHETTLEPLVCIVILNCNGKEMLKRALDNLGKTSYGNMRILVVDNESSDGSVDFVRSSYPHVEVLALPRNFGYAKANNFGIVYALRRGAKYVVLMNNDTEVVDPGGLD